MKEAVAIMEEEPRRFRRKEEDIRRLILNAARCEFGRHGYATTTRAIAQLADVSESLVFRYFGSKAALFDLVVFGPFNDLIARFNQTSGMRDDDNAEASSRAFVTELLQYLRANRMLIAAFVQTSSGRFKEAGIPAKAGLEDYFARAQASVEAMHHNLTGKADPAIWLAVRLGFAAVLGSVLFSDLLFAGEEPDLETLREGLVQLLVRLLQPPIKRLA
jgi:AcrR family transcriptional regulator